MMPDRSEALPYFFVLLLTIAVVFAAARVSQRIEKVGAPPDELAHISYIADAIDGRFPAPDYRSGKIIGGDLNYLNHPPLYYSVMGVAGWIFGKQPLGDFQFFRTLTSLINLLALVGLIERSLRDLACACGAQCLCVAAVTGCIWRLCRSLAGWTGDAWRTRRGRRTGGGAAVCAF